ncbi:hypothetical protein ACKWTF_012029 [Chironomus riparius]
MISKKFLYSEQILQLVLALSLLQVDPINYLEWGVSRVHNYDDGSPWQLEIAPTSFSDYPYMNRKTYVPLIEDLIDLDNNRIRSYDVQAYLLNFDNTYPTLGSTNDNEINNNNHNYNNQERNSTSNTSIASNTTSINHSDNESSNTEASSIEPTLNLVNLVRNRFHELEHDDVFLNSDLSASENIESIVDQNLADLHDYEDRQMPNFLNVPVKHENIEQGFLVGRQDESQSIENRLSVLELNLNRTELSTSDVIDWNEYLSLLNDSSTSEEVFRKHDKELTESIKTEANEISFENDGELVTSSVELTLEEMDLIEVLWKQDVDLGYNPPLSVSQKEATAEDDIEKLKALLEMKDDKPSEESKNLNPWAGLSYTIDTETGEYILQSNNGENNSSEFLLFDEPLQLNNISELNQNKKGENTVEKVSEESKKEDSEETTEDLEATLENNLKLDIGADKDDFDFDLNSSLSILLDETEDLDLLSEMMIQPSATHFQHPRQTNQNYAHCVNSYRQSSYQGRVPSLGRTMSMEQRWQDLANLLSFPPAMGMADMSSHASAHYPPHYPYQASGPMTQHGQFAHPHSHPAVLHNASLADISAQPSTSHHLQPYSSNLGSAVASSMHLTNSNSETDAGNQTPYKMEHDLMYYSQANPAEINHPSDGILNIFNDEDLQLMDMAVNEGMYTMRMLDQNNSCANASLGSTNALMGSNMHTNLSSGIASTSTSSSSTAPHVTSGDRLDASSDSAVSSMGSERVASLSDGEWNEAGSDSAQEYQSRKFIGPYDYRYNNSRMMETNRQQVPQKKHQMYGKRFAHESLLPPPPPIHHHPSNVGTSEAIPNIPLKYEPYEGYTNAVNQTSSAASSVIKPPTTLMDPEMKYSYSLDFPHQRHKNANGISANELISHNHTYVMPPHPHSAAQLLNGNGANPKPQTRDKKSKKIEDEHLTRDEKRARSLQIPITVQDIINLPMDEFNERLSKYDLSENQLSLIRDIRRRGKNKVAAQNCRKRKLDQIVSLADEVKDMKMRKERFLREREMLLTERRRIKDKFAALYRHVFTNLRDNDGNPYSSYQYSLQQSADGSVVLVPRSDQNSSDSASSGSSRGNNNNGNGNGHNSHGNNSPNFK